MISYNVTYNVTYIVAHTVVLSHIERLLNNFSICGKKNYEYILDMKLLSKISWIIIQDEQNYLYTALQLSQLKTPKQACIYNGRCMQKNIHTTHIFNFLVRDISHTHEQMTSLVLMTLFQVNLTQITTMEPIVL